MPATAPSRRPERTRRVAAWVLVVAALVAGLFVTTQVRHEDDSTVAAGSDPARRAPPSTPAPSRPRNPVLDRDFPDPSVLTADGGYVVFATGTGEMHIQIARSADLVHWSEPHEALPRLPPWVSKRPEVWAPAVIRVGARYTMVYSARDARTGRHCIGAATSADPLGPYDARESALLCDATNGGAIDPFLYVTGTTARLLWKNDGNCCGLPSAIWSQPIDLRAMTLVGNATRLLAVDQPWERSVDPRRTTVEAPSMVRISGRILLFYSANGYETTDYAQGYAICSSPDGPCAKPRSTPVLASAGATAGPGGGDAFRDRSGRWLLAYHGWDAAAIGYRAGGRRSLRIDPIVVDGDVVTVVGPTTGP
jgi:beta-xylosidase